MKNKLLTGFLSLLAVATIMLPANIGAKARMQEQSALSPGAPHVPTGSGFTYQGQLKDGGNPASGQYDFNFTLYDALTGGNQVGTAVNLTGQTVADGLFTVQLDFGANVFQGQARWLEIAVRQTGGGTYTTLSPRQPLTTTPYAESLMPGAVITGTLAGPALVVTNTNGIGVYGYTQAINKAGVYGNSSGNSYGVEGDSNSSYTAVLGYNTASSGGTGVAGIVTGSGGNGVYGSSPSGDGVRGESSNSIGVYGSSSHSDGVYGFTDNASGVHGSSISGFGVYGLSEGGFGYGGVYGVDYGSDGAGVIGYANEGPYAVGIRGESSQGYAGYFDGAVHVQGDFSCSCSPNFKIDDPLDPANKYLYHAAIESPDVMNMYNGNVTLDANGEAWVELPAYFEALNRDFRYQLTAVSAPGPNLYVAQKIAGNRFKIAGGTAGMEVSWQVTGIRQDPYLNDHRTPVEQDKTGEDKGKYLYPEGYGQPESMKINAWPKPDPAKDQAPQPLP